MTPRSPFARRIRLALRRLRLPVIETPCDVFADSPRLLEVNPLGMVPALRTPSGEGIFDSAAILEYLDEVHGGIWPRALPDRTRVRQASYLASGILQSAVQYFQETFMHEVPSPKWAQDHLDTMERSFGEAMNSPGSLWLRGEELTQAGWDLAVALDYYENRIKKLEERAHHPLLALIREVANRNQDFIITKP
ncbi:MAG: glutathione S-transferase family protein [Proteobacteria bacterium]|nr:glutathione S-transferase family protein [Pseudomonadota bacterium]